MELVETDKVSVEQLSINKYNPYYEQQLDCRRVVIGIIEWDKRLFFLNLLKDAVDRRINLCQFYKQFTEKYEQIEDLAREREFSFNFQKPSRQAAVIFSVLSRVFVAIDDEGVYCFCLDILEEDSVFNSDYFYLKLKKIYKDLKNLIEY